MAKFEWLYLAAVIGYILFSLWFCDTAARILKKWYHWWRWYQNLLRQGEEMTVSKRLTSKSGVTIPKHVRGEAGFLPGMAVDIETVEDGVLIRKRVPTCQFCGSVDKVVKIHGMEMCGKCADAIRKELDRIAG